MKHTLTRSSVFTGGQIVGPGTEVDLPKEQLIQMGELDAEGNPVGAVQVVVSTAQAVRLPEDAKERLMALERMSEQRADAIIETLTAEPAADGE